MRWPEVENYFMRNSVVYSLVAYFTTFQPKPENNVFKTRIKEVLTPQMIFTSSCFHNITKQLKVKQKISIAMRILTFKRLQCGNLSLILTAKGKIMAEVITFGCRINAYESEVIKEKLKDYDNLIVVNTCAVTGEAERQCRQTIRKLKRENPAADIIVTGCSAQISATKLAQMPEITLILGNKEKKEIEKYVAGIFADKKQVSDIFADTDCGDYVITGFEGRQKAFVQIQQGCNHRCTYCIIPYARGKNRSVPQELIVQQINELIAAGFKEICLTGVDICSYEPSFSDLIEYILQQIPQLPELNFGSLDPAAVDNKFIELLGKYNNISSHFHLSVQSGDNEVLKKMGRRHRRETVIDLCQKIRAIRPQARFGADFICGFPTESEANFNNTCKLVSEAGLNKLHVFPYSERSGTPAAKLPQLPMQERRRRAAILRKLSEEK